MNKLILATLIVMITMTGSWAGYLAIGERLGEFFLYWGALGAVVYWFTRTAIRGWKGDWRK